MSSQPVCLHVLSALPKIAFSVFYFFLLNRLSVLKQRGDGVHISNFHKGPTTSWRGFDTGLKLWHNSAPLSNTHMSKHGRINITENLCSWRRTISKHIARQVKSSLAAALIIAANIDTVSGAGF